MPTDRESDGLDALLREALERSTVAPMLCPDAEKVAAWHDGVLSRADARAVELHVADCQRCRAVAANLIRSEPPIADHGAPLWRRWRLQWIVPLAATASALAVWIAVPSRDARSPVAASATSVFDRRNPDERLPALRDSLDAPKQRQESAALQPATPAPVRPSGADTAAQQKSSLATRDAARVDAQRQADVSAAEPAPAATLPPPAPRSPSAAPVQAAAEPSAPAVGAARETLQLPDTDPAALRNLSLAETVSVRTAIEIGSPDPAVRWRVLPGAVEVSRTGGAQWTATPLPDQASAAAVTAGHAPDRQTCWLVGRAGLVLRSTDGATFVRVPFPPTVDLAGVRAQDGRQAVVTTVDGRQFGTADGGTTWESR